MGRLFRTAFLFCPVLLLSAALLLPAAASGGEQNGVSVRKKLRVVSLSPAVTELVYRLGAEDKLVGRSEVCDYPEAALSLPVAGKFGEANLEKIAALKADLVLSNDVYTPDTRRVLERHGVRFLVHDCTNAEQYFEWVKMLGQELDCRKQAEAETARAEKKLDNLKKLPPLKNCRVLFVVCDNPVLAAGGNSLPDMLIKLAGAENAGGGVAQPYFRCSPEWLFRNQPDVVVWSVPAVLDRKSRIWRNLRAVRKNCIVNADHAGVMHRPGPRMFDGAEQLRMELEKCLNKSTETGK